MMKISFKRVIYNTISKQAFLNKKAFLAKAQLCSVSTQNSSNIKYLGFYSKLEQILKQHKEKYPNDYNTNVKNLTELQLTIEDSISEALKYTEINLIKKNQKIQMLELISSFINNLQEAKQPSSKNVDNQIETIFMQKVLSYLIRVYDKNIKEMLLPLIILLFCNLFAFKTNRQFCTANQICTVFQKNLFDEFMVLYLSSIPMFIKQNKEIKLLVSQLLKSYNKNITFKDIKNNDPQIDFHIEPTESDIKDYFNKQCALYKITDDLTKKNYYDILERLFKETGFLFAFPLVLHLAKISIIKKMKITANNKILISQYFIYNITNQYSKSFIGKYFFRSLLDRNLILLLTEDQDDKKKVMGKKAYIKEATKYTINFDLPIDAELINLPMVVTPLKWKYHSWNDHYIGGYLKAAAISLMRSHVMGDKLHNNVYITPNKNTSKCLNYLQQIPYKINTNLLSFIEKNNKELIIRGLMTDPIYQEINPFDVARDEYCKNTQLLQNITEKKEEYANHLIDYQHYQTKYVSLKSQALREKYILEIAKLFKDYTIYFPAFLDFRGRIYRPGLLHIQSSDLGKALLLWDHTKIPKMLEYCIQKQDVSVEAYLLQMKGYFTKIKKNIIADNDNNDKINLTEFIENHPLKCSFLNESKHILAIAMHPALYELEEKIIINPRVSLSKKQLSIPCRKDATSSVYQLIALLSQNQDLAKKTNLINEGSIIDIYNLLSKDFQNYMEDLNNSKKYLDIKYKTIINLDDNKLKPVADSVTFKLIFNLFELISLGSNSRDFVKKIIMPLPYGVTPIRIAELIDEYCTNLAFSGKIGYKPSSVICNKLAFIINYYLKENYKDIFYIRDFLGNLGKMSAYLETPLVWDWGHGIVYQKYNTINKKQFNVYSWDKVLKKMARKSITVSTAGNTLDQYKSYQATPANIIHSLDAAIIAKVSLEMKKKYKNMPIATIHDCMCTIPAFSPIISEIYLKIMLDILNNPVAFIDQLLYNTYEDFLEGKYEKWDEECFEKLKRKTNSSNSKIKNKLIDKVLEQYKQFKSIHENSGNALKIIIQNSWKEKNIGKHGPLCLSF
nr:putative DNA-directed RNA polymerase [Oedogonium sp. 1_circle_61917]